MAVKHTKRTEDYSKWYNELVVKADLAENSAVRGCMVIKPYGYAIWEKMQAELDRKFKETEEYMADKEYSFCIEGLINMKISVGSRVKALRTEARHPNY